jgi:hypothetical protein
VPPVGLSEAVHHIEGIEQRLWDGHSSVDARAAFLEGFEDHGLVVEIDTAPGQREGFRYAAAGVAEHAAQRADGLSVCEAA